MLFLFNRSAQFVPARPNKRHRRKVFALFLSGGEYGDLRNMDPAEGRPLSPPPLDIHE